MEAYKPLLKIAKAYANAFSDDPTTRVGCIIVDENNQVVSMGTNHSPYAMKLNSEGKNREKFYAEHINNITGVKTKEKLNWIEHAERNAIFNALNHGTSSLKGYTLIATLAPCINCTRAIISVGIGKVVTFVPCPAAGSKWGKEFLTSKKLFEKAGIEVVEIGVSPAELNIDLADHNGWGWEKTALDCYAPAGAAAGAGAAAAPKEGGRRKLKLKSTRKTRKQTK